MGSDVFFHGLREGETSEVKLEEGKQLVVRLTEIRESGLVCRYGRFGGRVGAQNFKVGADLLQDIAGFVHGRIFDMAHHVDEKHILPKLVFGWP